MHRRVIWGVPIVLYAIFCVWYTDCGGPLQSEEIDGYLTTLEAQEYPAEGLVRMRAFLERDTGRQFLMMNFIDMSEDPPDVEGAERGETAQQLMDRYMEHMYRELLMRACHPVIFGEAINRAMDVVGIEGAEEWTTGAVVRWRSRRTLMEVVSNPEMKGRHEFKLAALDKTIAFPIETQLYLGDLRVLLGLVLLSATALIHIATGSQRARRER